MFVSLFIVYQTFILHISGSKIPDFSYKNINNKIVRVSSLPRLKTLIVFFSTDCDYCTDAISEIKKISIKRKDVNYLFVTEEKDLTSVSTFVKKNKLNEITPYILIDYNKNFQKDFGLGFSMSIPTILHYDKNGNFVKEIIDYDELKTI
ncbi:TlpA family protein disulfide reductase [Flavobacterium dankookense]|nr:redoxin family protein [Flavobacterium dankookense]